MLLRQPHVLVMTQGGSRGQSLAAALRGRIAGEVVVPGDEGWDDARAAWNLALDQRPDAVVFAESDDDVVAVVRLAGERGVRVAAQATGHGASSRESLEGAILLRTERMNGVRIDVEGRRAHVQAGAQWMHVAAEADEHDAATVRGQRRLTLATVVGLGRHRLAAARHGLAGQHPLRRGRHGGRRAPPGRSRPRAGPLLGAAGRRRAFSAS